MCFPDDGKIRVCLDAEYAGRDTDEVLKICSFQDEALEFADEWATRQAERMVDKNDPDFEAMKRIYKKQLCYYDFDKAPKSEHLQLVPEMFWKWDLKQSDDKEVRNKDYATGMSLLSKEISNAKAPVIFKNFSDKLEEIVQIVGYRNVEKNLKTNTKEILSIEFDFRDVPLED